jgi:hypothetical protein
MARGKKINNYERIYNSLSDPDNDSGIDFYWRHGIGAFVDRLRVL